MIKKSKGVQSMSQTVKSTVNINRNYFEEIKHLISIDAVSSLTEGINIGLEMFLREKKKEMYAKEMAQAAKDKDFIERTLASQKDFDSIDMGVPEEW